MAKFEQLSKLPPPQSLCSVSRYIVYNEDRRRSRCCLRRCPQCFCALYVFIHLNRQLKLLSSLNIFFNTDIWTTLVAGGQQSSAAVRQPQNNSPVESATSADQRCNRSPSAASQTVNVAAGSSIGFILDNTLYHSGPAAIYLGRAPGQVASWDGSGANWFKVYSSTSRG